MNKAEEVTVVDIELPSGDVVTQCLIREKETGLFFSVDASFVEQEVGPIHSPYGHGIVTLDENGEGEAE